MSEIKRVPLLVLSGGPGGFKSAAQRVLTERLAAYGVRAICPKEPDTLLYDMGIDTKALRSQPESQLIYEKDVLKLQLMMEIASAELSWHSPAEREVIICDRGALDIKAYLGPTVFAELLRWLGLTEEELIRRYWAVFHLVTLANGAPEHYNLDNPGRIETLEQARRLDERTKTAWSGHPYWRLIPNPQLGLGPGKAAQQALFDAKMAVLFKEVCLALSQFYGEPICPEAGQP